MTADRDQSLRAITERTLSVVEAQAYLAAPISDEERAETIRLSDWFQRRYPTPLERLRYVTRAYRRWKATVG
jgi:hypothetical protein